MAPYYGFIPTNLLDNKIFNFGAQLKTSGATPIPCNIPAAIYFRQTLV